MPNSFSIPDDELLRELQRAAGDGPCDTCSSRERCAAQLLACQAFAEYSTGASDFDWRIAPRQPSAARYRAIFAESGSTEKRCAQEVCAPLPKA